jgi:hypothetical protein
MLINLKYVAYGTNKHGDLFIIIGFNYMVSQRTKLLLGVKFLKNNM